MPDQVEEPPLVERATQDNLKLRHPRTGVFLSRDRAPRLEPLAPCAERADSRQRPVRHDEGLVGCEQCRDLRLIGLKLLVGHPHRRVLVGWVLEFDDRKRETVHKQDDVRSADVLAFGNRELIDRQPVVVVGDVEVDDASLIACDRAISAAVLDCYAFHEHSVHSAVALDQRWRAGSHHLPEGVLQSLCREPRVEPSKRIPQPVL